MADALHPAVTNTLAKAVVLLHRAAESLGAGNSGNSTWLLKTEIATFYKEAKDSISEALEAERVLKASAQSARPAANGGGLSNSGVAPHQNSPSLAGLANVTEPPISPEAPSGNSSSGGIPASLPPFGQPCSFSPPTFSPGKSDSKPPSFSGRFLKLTYKDGRPVLVNLGLVREFISYSPPNSSFHSVAIYDEESETELRETLEQILELLNA